MIITSVAKKVRIQINLSVVMKIHMFIKNIYTKETFLL